MLPYFSLKYFFAAVFATLVAAAAYHLLPEKRSLIVPNAENKLALFFDGKRGGKSQGYWDSRHPSKAICEINPGEEFPYCGFLVSLGDGKTEGLNFDGYQGVRVNFTYAGPSPRLRIFMRNYDPAFSKPEKVETAKFNNISVPVEDLKKPLYLNLADFSVAEWWLADWGVPRDMSHPEFTNIIKFGFDLPGPATYGRHELQLDRLELVGKWVTQRQWYLSLAVAWILFVVVWSLQHRLSVRRWMAQDAKFLADVATPASESMVAEPMEPLTGAVSRAALGSVVAGLYDREGYRCDPLAMVLFDIDGFRKINKRFGPDVGNETIAAVSRIIISNSRATDILCHWSNDRFLVIAPGTRGVALVVFAEKIRGLIEQHRFHREGGVFAISVSAGIAESTPAKTFEQTFKVASRALLQAKALGKNKVHYSC